MARKDRQKTELIVHVEEKNGSGKARQKAASKKKSDAKKKRHNTAFVVGSVTGGLAGAAAALWKTPYSGQELREKITGRFKGSDAGGDTVQIRVTGRPRQQSIQGRILSTIENTLAPIVGVKLGKTANDSGANRGADTAVVTTTTASTTMSSTNGVSSGFAATSTGHDETPGSVPAFPDDEPLGYGDDAEVGTGSGANVTPVDQDGGEPSRMSSPVEPAPEADAATIDELTKPQIDLTPDALQTEEGDMHPFPKLGGSNKR